MEIFSAGWEAPKQSDARYGVKFSPSSPPVGSAGWRIGSPKTKMKINLTDKPSDSKECRIIGFFETKGLNRHSFFLSLLQEDRKYVDGLLKKKRLDEPFFILVHLPSSPAKSILLLKLDKKNWGARKRTNALRKIIVALKESRVKSALFNLEDFAVPSLTESESVRRMAEDFLMAEFSFVKYKEKPKGGWPEIKEISIFVPRISKGLKGALEEGIIIGGETNHCRILANTPGGDMTPKKLAEAALKEKAPKLKTKILDQKEIKKLGMGGIIGVSRGSGEQPRFIIMEYRGGKKDERPVVFVGKGITFDSGGLNLKPGSGICEMHMDMSGGAAVIHALAAIAKIGLKINIIGLVPAVENMPSGSSYRPGDILKTITGKTIEALNTDAEGRIILADALGYAQKYKPKIIIDVATLTGAAIVALGQRVNAVFATSPELEKLSREVGEKSGDEAWPLPLWDDYAEEIKSDFADIANIGKNRYGDAIIGAIFLKQFVGDFPWVHLDIAPTMTPIENQYLGKGATGAGTRFLVELAKRYQTKN